MSECNRCIYLNLPCEYKEERERLLERMSYMEDPGFAEVSQKECIYFVEKNQEGSTDD